MKPISSDHTNEQIDFYKGPPYEGNERVYIVDIDQFAILHNKNCFVFKMTENSSTLICTLDNIDYLCTEGISSCIGIYSECLDSNTTSLAHMSVSCGLINDKLVDIKKAINSVVKSGDKGVNIQFHLYGGSPITYEVVTNNETIIAPEDCYIDPIPQLVNRDTDESDEESEEENLVNIETNQEGAGGLGRHKIIKNEDGDKNDYDDDDGHGDEFYCGDSDSKKDDAIAIYQYESSLVISKFDALANKTNLYTKPYGKTILIEKKNQEETASTGAEPEKVTIFSSFSTYVSSSTLSISSEELSDNGVNKRKKGDKASPSNSPSCSPRPSKKEKEFHQISSSNDKKEKDKEEKKTDLFNKIQNFQPFSGMK